MAVHAGLDSLRVRIAYGMFDTRGRIDPFSPDSPLKLIRVEQFPADFFFVLRVVQVPLTICGFYHPMVRGHPRVWLSSRPTSSSCCAWCRCRQQRRLALHLEYSLALLHMTENSCRMPLMQAPM